MQEWSTVSIVTPTLNAASVLEKELKSVREQDYPQDKIEIIIADGGSTDDTLKIAKKYGAKVYKNPLKTGEAGKAVGVKKATGEFVALIDSDNFLPTKNWLQQMISPLLKHKDVVGSEPWEYTWVKEAGFIDRYCALIGMNDPFVHFLGLYDRMDLLTGKWTEVEHEEKDYIDYILVRFDRRGLPTTGANGTVLRSSFLKEQELGDYLFDIDLLAKAIDEGGSVKFIKVKNGIIHAYCGSDIKKFARKQRRRIDDFLFHKFVADDRRFRWQKKDSPNSFALLVDAVLGNMGMIEFLLSSVLVFPLIFQSLKGYFRKKDTAWFFHIVACEITLWSYFLGFVNGVFIKKESDRSGWGQ
jgi:glycosyltransferase involved in cell wall biosynthesis